MKYNFQSAFKAVARLAGSVLFTGACLVIIGCGQNRQSGTQTNPDPPSASPETSAAPTEIPVSVLLHGVVRFDGPRPKRIPLKTQGDPKCAAMHGDIPLLSDGEIVTEDGGVQNAFVYLENPPEHDGAVPEDTVVLDQLGCVYTPHVLGVRVGQPLDITNSDQTMHNIRSFSRKNRAFNNAQPAGAKKRTKMFKEVEMPIKMKCDFHPWMTAYIFVMDHPFFAVTDETGAFEIGDVPPGDYTLVSVHEKYREQKLAVTVTDGAVDSAYFTYASGG